MLRHCMRVVCGMRRVCCMLYIYAVLAPHLQATARQAIALHDTCTMHCNDEVPRCQHASDADVHTSYIHIHMYIFVQFVFAPDRIAKK